MILDTAISSISEETGINRGGIDVEITDGLPVAIKCTLILIIRITERTNSQAISYFFNEMLHHLRKDNYANVQMIIQENYIKNRGVFTCKTPRF